jgi:angiogenesis inhibitor 2
MVDAENKDKWDDAQQVRGPSSWVFPFMTLLCLGPLHLDTLCPQVSPGSVHLLRVVEDFIHLVGDALKAFQSSLIVTDNLGTRRQAGEGVLDVTEPRPLWMRDGF